MAPKWQWTLMVALTGALLLGACTSNGGGTDGATTTSPGAATSTTGADSSTSTSPPVPETTLVVWVDAARAPVVEAAAENFEAAYGTEVEVEVMPFREIRGAVMTAVPAGEGPDLFIDSNEGTGTLVEAEIIAPVDLAGREEEFFSVALDTLAYEGEIYGVPFVFEAVGLFYNQDLVEAPPADFDALLATCDDLGYPTGDGVPCLAIPAGEPLHLFPFIAGFGGYVFGFENRTYEIADVGLDSAGAIEGATFLDGLYRDGYLSSGVDYIAMADLFNQGAVPFMWTGPWQLEAVDTAGVNYGVVKLPVLAGQTPRPFVGSQGVFVNALSERTELAMAFLFDHLAVADTMVQLSAATNRPPALRTALDEMAGNPTMRAFADSGIGGLPLPNVEEMDAVWGPLGSALAALGQGTDDPAAAMTEAAELVRSTLSAG